jgi:hypothetical protein
LLISVCAFLHPLSVSVCIGLKDEQDFQSKKRLKVDGIIGIKTWSENLKNGCKIMIKRAKLPQLFILCQKKD